MVPEINEQSYDYRDLNIPFDEGFLDPPPTPPPPMTVTSPSQTIFRELVETALLMIFILWAVNTLTGRFMIEGSSMVPTLQDGEYVLVNKLSYYLKEPARGDIIVLHFPNDRSRDFIKRIIGLPGDTITVENKEMLVNGVPLIEPYIFADTNGSGTWVVPEDQYFVAGDNRNHSTDSRFGWFLPREDIVGRAWIIYWAPNATSWRPWEDNAGPWRLVPHYPHPEIPDPSPATTTIFLSPTIP